MIRTAALFAAAVLMSATALAGTVVSVPPFTAIAAHGGAEVVLKHGNNQRVTVLKGDPNTYRVEVVGGGKLEASPCHNFCWGNHELKIEVVSPLITSIEAHGGGAVRTDGDFPKQPVLNLQAHGGGAIDVTAIPANAVNAQAHGGGAIRLKALSELDAQAHGGGAITFWGNPARLHTETHGGGSISKAN